MEVADLIAEWVAAHSGAQRAGLHSHEKLITLGDGYAPAKPGDWVVRDKFNEFWPLPGDVFLAVYETSF